ncbi:hypothetical protein B0H15DRAFT_963202 [Mycena belliarum]|uniref:Uncharacterized protein n=1 Tax=Mycena belliarum TaxID=1033014 RepID=A0AAD6XUL2_9AGAR|nr:hypothetical protein B0H15DRAFT_963202 [Mycena belliae]
MSEHSGGEVWRDANHAIGRPQIAALVKNSLIFVRDELELLKAPGQAQRARDVRQTTRAGAPRQRRAAGGAPIVFGQKGADPCQASSPPVNRRLGPESADASRPNSERPSLAPDHHLELSSPESPGPHNFRLRTEIVGPLNAHAQGFISALRRLQRARIHSRLEQHPRFLLALDGLNLSPRSTASVRAVDVGIERLCTQYPRPHVQCSPPPPPLHNSQDDAWFVLDDIQNNRCGGFFAPDRSRTRSHNLFLYSNEFPASNLRAEKQRTTRLILVTVSHALGALTAAVGIERDSALDAPCDRFLADADALPLWIPSHSISVSLGSTVCTRGAGFDTGTIGAPAADLWPLRPPLPALPEQRDPSAPSEHLYPRNTLAPNGFPCPCEGGRILIADPFCVIRHTSDAPRALFLRDLPLQSRVLPARASIRLDPRDVSREYRSVAHDFVTIPKLVNTERLYQAIINGALRFYGPSSPRPGTAFFDFKPVETSPLAVAARFPGCLSIEIIAAISIHSQIWSITGDFSTALLRRTAACRCPTNPDTSKLSLDLDSAPNLVNSGRFRWVLVKPSVKSTISILLAFKFEAQRRPFHQVPTSNEPKAALRSAADSALRRNPKIPIEINPTLAMVLIRPQVSRYPWPYSGLLKLLMISNPWPSSLKPGAVGLQTNIALMPFKFQA